MEQEGKKISTRLSSINIDGGRGSNQPAVKAKVKPSQN